MARLIAAGLCAALWFAGGCSDGDAGRGAASPERLPPEVEARFQEREALKYGLDQLDQEGAARRAAGLPVPREVQPGAAAPAPRRPGP